MGFSPHAEKREKADEWDRLMTLAAQRRMREAGEDGGQSIRDHFRRPKSYHYTPQESQRAQTLIDAGLRGTALLAEWQKFLDSQYSTRLSADFIETQGNFRTRRGF